MVVVDLHVYLKVLKASWKVPKILKKQPSDQSGREQHTSLGCMVQKFAVLDSLNLSELVYRSLIALPSIIVITSDAPNY